MSYVSVKLSQVTVTKNLCKLNDEWLWWQYYWWFRSLLLLLFNVLCGVVSFIIFASVFLVYETGKSGANHKKLWHSMLKNEDKEKIFLCQ